MPWREQVDSGYTYGLSTRSSFEEMFWSEEGRPLPKSPAWGSPERVNDSRPVVWEVRTDSVGETVRSPGRMSGGLKSVEGARMRVDEHGVICRIEAVYRSSDRQGDVRRCRFPFDLSDIGSVSLSAPSRAEIAREKRTDFAAKSTDCRKYVRLSVESGSIATDSRVSVFKQPDGERKYVAHTDREVSESDVLYINARTDSGHFNEAAIGYGDRSAVGTPPTLDGRSRVVAFRRDAKYESGTDVAPPG